MKKEFLEPSIEIVIFSVEDIITISNVGDTDWGEDMNQVTEITGVK